MSVIWNIYSAVHPLRQTKRNAVKAVVQWFSVSLRTVNTEAQQLEVQMCFQRVLNAVSFLSRACVHLLQAPHEGSLHTDHLVVTACGWSCYVSALTRGTSEN